MLRERKGGREIELEKKIEIEIEREKNTSWLLSDWGSNL